MGDSVKQEQNLYHFLDTFCFRVPFFSLNFYMKLLQKSHFEFCDFKELWNQKVIQEAFYLASPDLFFELQKLIEKNDLENISVKYDDGGSAVLCGDPSSSNGYAQQCSAVVELRRGGWDPWPMILASIRG